MWAQLDRLCLEGETILKNIKSDWLRLRPGLSIGCPIVESTIELVFNCWPSRVTPPSIPFTFMSMVGSRLPAVMVSFCPNVRGGFVSSVNMSTMTKSFKDVWGAGLLTTPEDRWHAGAVELNSFSAEIQAHLFARLLLLQSSFLGGVRMCRSAMTICLLPVPRPRIVPLVPKSSFKSFV